MYRSLQACITTMCCKLNTLAGSSSIAWSQLLGSREHGRHNRYNRWVRNSLLPMMQIANFLHTSVAICVRASIPCSSVIVSGMQLLFHFWDQTFVDMDRPDQILFEGEEPLSLCLSRWRRCLRQVLREIYMRELASWWGTMGGWLNRVKHHRPLNDVKRRPGCKDDKIKK